MAIDPKRSTRPRSQRPGSVIGIVVSRFHEELTGAMLESARRELVASGVSERDLHVVWVPGAFELPIAARRIAQRPSVDAVLCLGLVLKGETDHDVYVAQGAVQGIVAASIAEDTPILFGVLTCETIEQARARALPPERGGREDPERREREDKGRAVASAAIETLIALDQVEELDL